MSTPSESSSNNECQNRASSPTIPNSNGNEEGEKNGDGTLEDLAKMSKLSEDLKCFIRAYFACSPAVIEDEHFFSFVYAYASADGDEEIAKLIFGSRFSEVYLPKYEYECNLIRSINAQNDARGLFSDFLFDKFTKLFDWPLSGDPHFHRIFINPSFTDYFAIYENVCQISGGTTGLASWQAACVMAEFLRSGVLEDFPANSTERFTSTTTVPVKKLNFLELGAGCGLSGISVAKFLPEVVGSLTLTDHADRVLQRLCANVELNFGGSEALRDKIRVQKLDWLDYDLDELVFVPEVIFASDVIFDPEIIGPFCALLHNLLTFKPCQKQSNCSKNDESSDSKESLADEDSSSPLRLAYVAATIRNPDTIDCFRKELVLKGLYIRREFLHNRYRRYFETAGEQLYHFTPIFPSISTSRLLDLPTLIFEIGAECFRFDNP